MKLTKELYGCAEGEVYPRIYAAGEECPPELEEAAHTSGALDVEAAKAEADRLAAEEAAKAKGKKA